MSTIDLLITACLIGNPAACSDIRAHTPFLSVKACEGGAQPILAEIMATYPAWRVVQYECKAVSVGREV